MKLELSSPFTKPSGTYKGCEVVYMQVGGRTVARRRVKPSNPKTRDQQRVRLYMARATQGWEKLSDAQRAGWQDYAAACLGSRRSHQADRNLGMRAYVRASMNRQIMGLGLAAGAPRFAPPPDLLALRQAEAESASCVALTVEHDLADTTGHYLAVRATAGTRTPACTPHASEARYVCGVSAESCRPLPPSGGTVVFCPARYCVGKGQRYGIEARIVRAEDGIAGRALFADFIKIVVEAEPQAVSAERMEVQELVLTGGGDSHGCDV